MSRKTNAQSVTSCRRNCGVSRARSDYTGPYVISFIPSLKRWRQKRANSVAFVVIERDEIIMIDQIEDEERGARVLLYRTDFARQ